MCSNVKMSKKLCVACGMKQMDKFSKLCDRHKIFRSKEIFGTTFPSNYHRMLTMCIITYFTPLISLSIVLISDVVRLSGTYLILLIRIRLYLCRLDYIFYCTYCLGYPYCPSSLGRLIVLSLLFSLGTFLLFPMDYCLV